MEKLEYIGQGEAIMADKLTQSSLGFPPNQISSMIGGKRMVIFILKEALPSGINVRIFNRGQPLKLGRASYFFPEAGVKIVKADIGHSGVLLIDQLARAWLILDWDDRRLDKNDKPIMHGFYDALPPEIGSKEGAFLLPPLPSIDQNIVQVAIDWLRIAVVTRAGQVFAMGWLDSQLVPWGQWQLQTGLPPVKTLVLTADGILVLDWEGRLWIRELELKSDSEQPFRPFFREGPRFIQLSGSNGRADFITLDSEGQAWTVGYLGIGNLDEMDPVQEVPKIKKVVFGGDHYLVDLNDQVWAFGPVEYRQLRRTDGSSPQIISEPKQQVDMVAGCETFTVLGYHDRPRELQTN